jgi:hypothetical protein
MNHTPYLLRSILVKALLGMGKINTHKNKILRICTVQYVKTSMKCTLGRKVRFVFFKLVSCIFIIFVRVLRLFFIYFFGGLECVGHSFVYVALFVVLRDVWIRTQRAAVASRLTTNLATHLPTLRLLVSLEIPSLKKGKGVSTWVG